MRRYFSILQRSPLVRSAGTLVGGTAAGQLLAFLSLPLLTRLYAPDEFNTLAVYVAVLSMLSVAACSRLEIAVPLPDSDQEAASVLFLALTSSILFGGITAGVIFILFQLSFLADSQPLGVYTWLLPVGVILAGGYASIQYWSTRKKRFRSIAVTRVSQIALGVAIQVAMGWFGGAALGLVLGHMAMASAGVLRLGRESVKQDYEMFRQVSWRSMTSALSKYRRFPQYSVVEAICNNAAVQVPVLVIASLAIGPEAGYLFLATRMLGTPVTLIGGAVSQVYLANAPGALRTGELARFSSRAVISLARIGVAPIVFLGVLAPLLFSYAFGPEWKPAGDLVAWMIPWFVLKLVSSPISMVMHVRMMQRAMLILMVIGLLLRLSLTLIAFEIDPTYITKAYALSGGIFYLLMLMTYLRVAGVSAGGVAKIVLNIALPAAVALGAASLLWALF